MIPYNIRKEHLIQAIEKIDREGVPAGAQSDYYDLLYKEVAYPPKLVVSWANIFANGRELERSSFEGGVNTACFNLLDQEGFEIVSKQRRENILYEHLIKFLRQAQENDLKTASYLKQYKGLKVKVSFGQGSRANVPWIALLKEGDDVQQGIYPVYLYYVQQKVLVLAYGLSETTKPNRNWKLEENPQTIKEYFAVHYRAEPFRYSNSYIFRVYPIDVGSPSFGLQSLQVVQDANEIVEQYKYSIATSVPSVEEPQPIYQPQPRKMNHPLNTILYGPPGTGKTYNSVAHALSIIKEYSLEEVLTKQKTDPKFREIYKAEYDQLLKDGQIALVTFHQSFGYEEFVEGIKPKVNTSGEIEYNIEDGIFKKMCLLAGENKLTQNFDSVYDQYITQIIDHPGDYELRTLIQGRPFIVRVSSKRNCVAVPRTEAATEMIVSKKMLRNYIEHGVIDDWKPYTTAIAHDMRTKYSIDFKVVNNTQKKFVLIIDEINRGNISKIFGELITLIEPSKRLGELEELRLKLAYSGAELDQQFGVPNNLYIIGTMNSTDRSIALMDTALRRRFTFLPYSADTSLLSTNIDGINLQQLLSVINQRVEYLLDKDHLIGHAYLIDVTSKNQLCDVFRNKIIPLLEEYFYGDYEKVQLVLGDNRAFGKREDQRIYQTNVAYDPRKLFGTEIDGYEERSIYKLNEHLLHQNYESISADFFTSIYSKQ